jgi:hypothetical protein
MSLKNTNEEDTGQGVAADTYSVANNNWAGQLQAPQVCGQAPPSTGHPQEEVVHLCCQELWRPQA